MTPTRSKSVAELVDGRKIVLTQLTQKDYFSVLKQARKNFLFNMVECIPDELSTEDKDKLRALAFKEMQEMSVDSDCIWKDLDNLVFIFWLAIRPEQPTISLDDVGKMIEEPGNIERLISAINDIKAGAGESTDEKKS